MKPAFLILASALTIASAAPLAPTATSTTINMPRAATPTPTMTVSPVTTATPVVNNKGPSSHIPKHAVNGTSVHHRNNGINKFLSFDLTHRPLTSQTTILEVNKLCTARGSVADLRHIHNTIQRVDVTILRPAVLAAPAHSAKSKALKCQLYRNQVLEETCEERADAILHTSARRFARIQASIRNATAKIDHFCKGVDVKLFMDLPAAMATDARFRDHVLDRAAFAKIDVSKKSLNGTQTEAAAQFICPVSASSQLLERNRKIAEDAELDLFNHAIKVAGMDSAKVQALTCRKARNEILENVCAVNYLSITKGSPSELKSAKGSLADSVADVNEFCVGVKTNVPI
ncbi:hypothetical protein BDK51DRAFT_46632 [Blyttiomyces helicus]|uniref:Uncharacterized protein n=1 Tax=Blyttiomyces helicus TaxID=388810 RepID=A0A4P9WFE2_9FUNG|nr:hypothetical protein BDK51DRAFT_46632 [Blyttiomyces helicus]|eukprot:RKO90565.1 hypothetical protein BDK51DRAFT_46632 [Blyttiomyces helicus]